MTGCVQALVISTGGHNERTNVFQIKYVKVSLLCECTQGGGTSHALVRMIT